MTTPIVHLFSLSAFLLLMFTSGCKQKQEEPLIKISLAEWSLHRTLEDGKMSHLDFPRVASQTYGLQAIEYVNAFFADKAQDTVYLNALNDSCNKYDVRSLLIMIDDEGDLGDTNEVKRKQATKNHLKWIDAAAFLNCHSIRVNAVGEGDKEDVKQACIESITALCTYASNKNINVIIENHYGHSCDPQWVVDIIKQVNKANCGTLPDFGNFTGYDLYGGTAMLMPYAKGVSGKSLDFDAQGNEKNIDYARLMKIIKDSKFAGYIDIEYEGEQLSEDEGIRKTKALIEKYL